jgi:hypothetical protein
MCLVWACERVDNDLEKHVGAGNGRVKLEDVAGILARLPLENEQLQEVYDAVTSSSGNGYDEEYTMKHLFECPGSGVGDEASKASASYASPLRDMIQAYVHSSGITRVGQVVPDADGFLEALMESDIQIYWPFSQDWDGDALPVITFDPEDGSDVNIGYRMVVDDDGFRHVEEVMVDEEMASDVPVWIVNRNSDAGYTTLEMMRREDPEWGEGGGNIIVRPDKAAETRASSGKALILRDFTMNRNYDSWFAGASEFFVKIGYLEDLTAMTEAELRLYDPVVTDFMIVVRRSQMGVPQDFNAVLMTDWSPDVDWCAFMITEDDGGTRTEWTSKAKVFIEGKSYGFEISLPLNSRDDVVWRGRLASRWLEENSSLVSHFGDVDLTFEVVEY